MRRARAAAIVTGITLAVSAALVVVPRMTLSASPTEETARVALETVTMGPVERTVRAAGRIRGTEEFAALALQDGIVAEVCVRPGERVEAGQALVRMDSTAAEAALSSVLRQRAEAVTQGGEAAEAAREWIAQRTGEASAALAGTIIRAPAAGTVQQVLAVPHGGLAAGSPAVTLAGEERQVLCAMVLRDAAQVKTGMRARVWSGGELLCGAWVSGVAPAAADAATGQTVSVVTLIPDELPALPLGTAVEAEVILCGAACVGTLSSGAVTGEGTCWWAADGRAYEIPVTVLMDDGVRCWVDLPEGTQVVTDGTGLVQGQRIREAKR